MTRPRAVDASLELVLREERTRLIAALVRILDDWDLAEELVQDAAIAALEHWPGEGLPKNPAAWLMTTARRRAVDRLRRDARYRERLARLGREVDEMDRPMATDGVLGADDRLRLLLIRRSGGCWNNGLRPMTRRFRCNGPRPTRNDRPRLCVGTMNQQPSPLRGKRWSAAP